MNLQTLVGYNAAGHIIRTISGIIEQIHIQELEQDGLSTVITDALFLFSQHEHYVHNGQLTERPASPVTLSDLTLQSVPTGSTLTINGERYDAEGDVELEFPLSGTYRLRVECWPYKDWEGEVVV